MDQKRAALLTACCGAAIFIGVLMPWYSVSIEVPTGLEGRGGPWGQGLPSLNGTQGDFLGTPTLILGLAGGIAAALLRSGKTQGLPLNARQLALASLGTMGLAALLTVIDVTSHGKGVSSGPMNAGKSFGIYLTLLATLAGTYGAWVLTRNTPDAPGSPPASPPASPP